VPDAEATVAKTMTPPQPTQRARRPTTLSYCERKVALPRVRHTKPSANTRQATPHAPNQPKAAIVTVAAEVIPAPAILRATTTRVVAPTATPEDSYVEDGSSSGGAEFDALPLGESVASAATVAVPDDTRLLTAVTASSAAQRPDDNLVSASRRTLETPCLETQSIPEVAPRLSTMTSSTTTSSTDATTTTQRSAVQRRAAMRRIHRVITGARQRLLRQLGHRTAAGNKPTATTAFSDDQGSSSSVAAADDVTSASTSSRSLVAVAGCSSTAAGVAPTATPVDVDICSSVESSTAALSDAETVAADVSIVLGDRRISPSSPSYDDKHARFSHVGAHALDVFYSPDDDDDEYYETVDRSDVGRTVAAASNSSLWRPLASCSSAVVQQRSSASPRLPTRSVAFADHRVTSGQRLPSLPETVWKPCVVDHGSDSVHGLSDNVIKVTSSVPAVLSPTEASRSSTLTAGDNENPVDITAAVECEGSRLDDCDNRFVFNIFTSI